MARCSPRNISAILEIDQVLAHVLMAPGIISSKLGDVIPLIVRGPSKIHSIDLGAATKRCSARIQDTQSKFPQLIRFA
jgi:hypothetical protein